MRKQEQEEERESGPAWGVCVWGGDSQILGRGLGGMS